METYTTKSLTIAAFLYSSKLRLVDTERINKEVFFSFTPKEKAEQLVKQYFDGQASCNPLDLFSKLNTLKDIIFSGGTL